ncbi:MAG: ribose ABC transporter permease [Cereibacter sphaeroides]|uniref:Ribose ABC transporter permease n=1 Tax=Cereibacter sphaeroides TaxID=1063 RepID=A0A2W5SJ29_CERSP|nr:MAG: ribose ABC transporter permease [Cereibacter sphaeroides]
MGIVNANAAPAVRTKRLMRAETLNLLGLVGVLVLLFVIAASLSPSFLNTFNLINVLRQIALYGIVSIGLTVVIITSGIDLSVGSIVGVVSVSTALMLNSGLALPLTILVALAMGLVFGMVNGVGIAFGRIPPFIMTLGSMVMLRGLALTIADGRPIDLTNADPVFAIIGRGNLLGIPVSVWIFLSVALIVGYVLRYTQFGRNVFAVGSNVEAARLSGVNVAATRIKVYMLSGLLAALTAVIFVSRLTVGEPTAGTGLELEAIAIAVIGGTSLFGGQGSVVGTIVGAAILAILANIMNLVGISPFTQQMVKGAIIILAVSFELLRRHR